jgi:hypothetical protein
MLDAFTYALNAEHFYRFLDIAKALAPIWIPFLLLATFLDLWLAFKQREWVKKQGGVLLEVRLPRELTKSPRAMELFLNNIYNSLTGNLLKVYLEGVMRTWFSLELVSIGGSVHFFVWCHNSWRQRVESQLYAQFPTIEIHEVPDYALGVHHDPEKLTIGFFGQLKLNKADAYPIKTYMDYGLDKDPKEEHKNDPIVSVLEYLGSLRKGEQAWIQILIQAHTKEGLKYGRLFTKPDWKKAIDAEIKKVLKEAKYKSDKDEKDPSGMHLSEGQKEVISAIERTTGKTAFDTMIRLAYIAEKEVFNGVNIGGLVGSMMQFNSNSLNSFGVGFGTASEYPWQDPFGKIKLDRERKLLEAYKRRSYFSPPFRYYGNKPFVLTTEELATIFHFPGEVAATPTLSRIPSKKAEAPANLPI